MRRHIRWIAALAVLGLVAAGTWLFLMQRGRPASDAAKPSHGVATSEPDFNRLLIAARSEVENLHPELALPQLQQAIQQQPGNVDARLDLANVYLLLDRPDDAAAQAREALNDDAGSAAAYYLLGCAELRLRHFEEAVKALSSARHIHADVAAASFQLGRAYQGLNQWALARDALREAVRLDPRHPSAHYVLAQVLLRLGDRSAAERELQAHQEIAGKQPNIQVTPATYERSAYTQILVPFQMAEQSSAQAIRVTFTDVTRAAFGGAAYSGPAALIDPTRSGRCDLVAREGNHLRLLANANGTFHALGEPLSGLPTGHITQLLVGDLNNDGVDDLLVLGDQGCRAFIFDDHRAARDITASCGLASAAGRSGVLADLDFTGKLGVWMSSPDGGALHFWRNQGNLTFKEASASAGVPPQIVGAGSLQVNDWNGDDLPDLFVGRSGKPPLLLRNQRTGPLTSEGPPSDWPAGEVFVVGDLNNDLRPDLVVARPGAMEVVYQGSLPRVTIPTDDFHISALRLVDYDNDGWLDIVAAGDRGVRIWRNLGPAGFKDVTAELRLDMVVKGPVRSFLAADFDGDGDTDLLLDVEGRGLQLLRNDGGNANRQLKLRLVGKRSNASGLGSRVTLSAGGWRAGRTYDGFPLEIGIGQHATIDALTVHWYDLMVTLPPDVAVDPKRPLTITEIQLPTGSCPYLYAWDGKGFRFVSDILGSAPAGLPAAAGHLIDADTDEFVWLGNETMFPPRDGRYIVQVTDELRELLYLDEAKLVVADHPAGTEAHPTCKLRPGKPFPPPTLVTLGGRIPLRRATRLDGTDVTAALSEMDGMVVSPPALRASQLRGLAEPHGMNLDFGPLPDHQTLVLALTGWLHFGGGMANIAGSENPDLPFPFPRLEAETPGGWKTVDVVVGAPSGKTKTIVVELTDKLPAGTTRLRLTTAFEIHWDRIALFSSVSAPPGDDRQGPNLTWLAPSSSDLHWRGFSQYADRPWYVPLTPVYERVEQTAPWAITPSGWCTRYGPVDELIARRDDAMVIMNGGDELTLTFDADRLPPAPRGTVRDFFLFTSGWDKDADYHVVKGWTVDPIPWHAMDDQRYGTQERPRMANDDWMARFNTRWVGAPMLPRTTGATK